MAPWLCLSLAGAWACGGPPAAPAAQQQQQTPPASPGSAEQAAPEKPQAGRPPPGERPSTPGATPPEATPAPSAARGAELYGRMCAVCHGENGEGYKADQAPALAHPDYLATVTDKFLEVAIRDGRTGTQMSAWGVEHAGPLTPADVKSVVAHIRSWQQQPDLKLDESAVTGDVARGAKLFKRECASCHAPGAPNLRLENPELLAHTTPGFLRHAIRKGRPGTPMPGFEKKLGARGVEDLVAYLVALPKIVAPPAYTSKLPPPLPLGRVPMNPNGPQPVGFEAFPKYTKVDVVAREYRRKAKMLLLDARAPSDYVREHIAGAVSVPFYDPSPYLDELPKDAWLVAYCGCPHAESGALAQKLMAAGFDKVTVLDEGLWDWKQKGHPMREGEAP